MRILGPKDRSKTLRSGYLFPVFPLWDHLELAMSQVNWDYYFQSGILHTSIFQTLMCLQITLGDYEDAILILMSRVGVELFPFYLASRWYKYYNSVNHILTSKIFSDCLFLLSDFATSLLAQGWKHHRCYWLEDFVLPFVVSYLIDQHFYSLWIQIHPSSIIW